VRKLVIATFLFMAYLVLYEYDRAMRTSTHFRGMHQTERK